MDRNSSLHCPPPQVEPLTIIHTSDQQLLKTVQWLLIACQIKPKLSPSGSSPLALPAQSLGAPQLLYVSQARVLLPLQMESLSPAQVLERDLGLTRTAAPGEQGWFPELLPGSSGNRSRRPRLEAEQLRWRRRHPSSMVLLQQEVGQASGCERPGPTEGSIRPCCQGWCGQYLDIRSKTETCWVQLPSRQLCSPSSYLTLLFAPALRF